MAKVDYPQEIRQLIGGLKCLPGIGPRSAERVAVWLMREPADFSTELSGNLIAARQRVRPCQECGFFSTEEVGCSVCSDPSRDSSLLCVVEQPTDVLPVERSGSFTGRYHVLGGRLSPLDNVSPKDLQLAELVMRVRDKGVTEVILALSSDVEGEATANYISDLLVDTGVAVTRIAQGIPAGGGLEHADALTLSRALIGRRRL